MKNLLLLGLAVLSTQGAFARERDIIIPGNRMDLTQCIKTLHNAETTINDLKLQLNQCQVSRPQGPGRDTGRIERENQNLRLENDSLRRDSVRLTDDNTRLSIELGRASSDARRLQDDNYNLQATNNDLRRQLDELRGPRPTPGYFSYAACKAYNGSLDTRYLASAFGLFPIEAESNAQIQTSKDFSCNYGVGIVKTEEIRSTIESNYCVSGCLDYTGKIDTRYIMGARGRNQAEAEFKSLKEAQAKYTCNYGVKVQVCQ